MTDRRDAAIAVTVLVWITGVLTLDHFSSLNEQRWLGVGTWLLLLGLLARESRRTRLQVAVVVCFATAVEYTFSGWLGVYVYRLHDVPWFVPPGHGLVYLAALAIGRSGFVVTHRRALIAATATVATAYAGWGLFISSRLDVLGAFWCLCLLASLRWSRQPTVFVGAFVIVTYLELFGTHIGAWAWSVKDPILHLVPMGNPPSGAAGGYGFFDLAALLISDAVGRRRATRQPAEELAGEDAEHVLVQPAISAHHTSEAGVGAT